MFSLLVPISSLLVPCCLPIAEAWVVDPQACLAPWVAVEETKEAPWAALVQALVQAVVAEVAVLEPPILVAGHII